MATHGRTATSGRQRQHALHAPRPFIEGEDGSVIKLELAPPTLAAAVTAAANRPVPVWIVGITLTILLVTCATVANLLLARAARREREVATRLALGSSRERLVRQFLAEALLLALFATVSGLGMATVGARFAAMLPLPPLGSVLDHSTLAVTLGLALLTTLLAGLAPGIWAARRNFSAALAGGSGRVTGSRSRLRNTLIGMQVALSFALLLGAVLFVRSLRNVHATDVGFDLSHLLLVQPAFPPGRSATDVTEYADATRAGLTRLPGVISVAASSSVPYGAMLFMTIERPDPRPDEGPLTVDAARVTASYFSTMRIAINQGRAFDSRDRADGPPVVIVSESLARAAWPRQSPLGQCLRLFTAPRDGVCLRVIGIASDARYQGILEPPHPFMYLAAGQATPGLGDAATIPRVFLVRARDRPAAIAGAVRRVLMMVDPTLPPVEVRPMADLLRPQTVPWEVGSKLFTVFGILALVLAGVGLYVVVAFLVTEREREFAIRQALGADRRKVIGLLLQHGLRLTLAGIAGGATVGAAFSRFLSSRLYDVSPLDPTTYAAVALVMLVVALLACFIPARAAAGTDPMMALRAE